MNIIIYDKFENRVEQSCARELDTNITQPNKLRSTGTRGDVTYYV